MLRRSAVLVVASLVASLGVLVGSELTVEPSRADAIVPEGLSTLAGSGAAGRSDDVGAAASFDLLIDVAVSPDGQFLYALEQGTGGRPNAIRKVTTDTGAVTTLATGGRLASSPTDIEVDGDGNPWVGRPVERSERDWYRNCGPRRRERPHNYRQRTLSREKHSH